jgi:hypothetical protein
VEKQPRLQMISAVRRVAKLAHYVPEARFAR